MHFTFEKLREEYKSLWDGLKIIKSDAAGRQAQHIVNAREHYLDIASATNVPWFVLGIIHVREAGDPPDFKAVLHNGERIIGTGRRTRLVPSGRGPFADFTTAGIDAVRVVDNLGGVNWYDDWGPEHVAFALESFNGFGYRLHHNIPSPYLWGGTNRQKRGKYVRDGVYDATVMDPQIGGMALLAAMMSIDPSISFDDVPVVGSAKALVA